MNTELIAAILKLASAQEAIATQLGRIADQLQPRDGPGGTDTGISVLTDAVADIASTMHETSKDVVYEMQQNRAAD